MNVRTALISSALLLAVLGWACEQGPTSPSALGTPGGGSLGAAGGVSLDAAGGVILGVNCQDKPSHPHCLDLGQRFNVSLTSATGDISGSGDTTPVKTPENISVGSFDLTPLTLGNFFANVTCVGPSIVGEAEGAGLFIFGDSESDHLRLSFKFTHNDANHWVQLLAEVPFNWPPLAAAPNPVTLVPTDNGDWEVKTRGKNSQNGCTGSGGGITWTATIVPL